MQTATCSLRIVLALLGATSCGSAMAQTASEDPAPKSGSAAGPRKSDQNATEESGSKVGGTAQSNEVLVNGALTAQGAPTDTDTIPSMYSTRTAADDKLPIAAYTFKHLTDEQRSFIRSDVGSVSSGTSGTSASGEYAVVGAELPPKVALENLKPLPDAIVAKLPEMRGIAFTTYGGKLLLINAKSRMVVAVID